MLQNAYNAKHQIIFKHQGTLYAKKNWSFEILYLSLLAQHKNLILIRDSNLRVHLLKTTWDCL